MINEIKILFYACIVYLLFNILSCCSTTEIVNSELISANSQAVGRIESTINSLDLIIRGNTEQLELISKRSIEITDGIERIEYLFNEYECESTRIINELIKERDRLKKYIKDNVDSNNNLSSIHNCKGNGDDN